MSELMPRRRCYRPMPAALQDRAVQRAKSLPIKHCSQDLWQVLSSRWKGVYCLVISLLLYEKRERLHIACKTLVGGGCRLFPSAPFCAMSGVSYFGDSPN